MKALVYRGPRDIQVTEVEDAKIEEPTDVLVRVTSTNICGSDLHMYEGRTSVHKGKVLGHEDLGVVIDVGDAVRRINPGDHVVIPFNIACGNCRNCARGFTGFCLTMNPGSAGGESIGAVPIDDSEGDPVEQIEELTKGCFADCGCECVGWQAHEPSGEEVPNETMNRLVASVRATGGLGVVGVFPPKDPKSPDKLMKRGQIAFDFGEFFEKGLRMGSGQTNVKSYDRRLRDLIHAGRARPSFIISHHCSLDDGPEAYAHFDARDDGWTKVILRPGVNGNHSHDAHTH